MSKYTLTIKEITENNIDIFNFEYNLFDNSYKPVLQEKIINHYYFREIGSETIGQFIFRLKTKLNEILPIYNKYYETEMLELRILDNYEVEESFNKTGSNTVTQGVTKSATDINKFSDSPQSRTTLTNEYITNLTDNASTETESANIGGNNTENWTRKMSGNIGVQTDSEAVTVYRKNLINIDMLVIEELNELFSQILEVY